MRACRLLWCTTMKLSLKSLSMGRHHCDEEVRLDGCDSFTKNKINQKNTKNDDEQAQLFNGPINSIERDKQFVLARRLVLDITSQF